MLFELASVGKDGTLYWTLNSIKIYLVCHSQCLVLLILNPFQNKRNQRKKVIFFVYKPYIYIHLKYFLDEDRVE
jgi:hypothetical protein